MANRAYLFSSDRPDDWEWYPEQRYYDSRHVIPLGWFFFYGSADVQLIDVSYGDSTWKEVRLSAEKNAAFDRFLARRPLLSDWNAGRLDSRLIEEFLETVRRRPGGYLMVNPQEIDICDHEPFGEEIARFLDDLDKGDREARSVLVEARPYIGDFADDPERSLLDVIGYTYGNDP